MEVLLSAVHRRVARHLLTPSPLSRTTKWKFFSTGCTDIPRKLSWHHHPGEPPAYNIHEILCYTHRTHDGGVASIESISRRVQRQMSCDETRDLTAEVPVCVYNKCSCRQSVIASTTRPGHVDLLLQALRRCIKTHVFACLRIPTGYDDMLI